MKAMAVIIATLLIFLTVELSYAIVFYWKTSYGTMFFSDKPRKVLFPSEKDQQFITENILHESYSSEYLDVGSNNPVSETRVNAKFFSNCAEAHSAGRYSIRRGDPAYSSGLDGDGDGIACE